ANVPFFSVCFKYPPRLDDYVFGNASNLIGMLACMPSPIQYCFRLSLLPSLIPATTLPLTSQNVYTETRPMGGQLTEMAR
ncbi:hypothetical protein ACFLTP_10670, partial [Chloroflexota bacterium]